MFDAAEEQELVYTSSSEVFRDPEPSDGSPPSPKRQQIKEPSD